MTPIEQKWAELEAEIAAQEKKLVPQWGRIKVLTRELLGIVVKYIAEEQKKCRG